MTKLINKTRSYLRNRLVKTIGISVCIAAFGAQTWAQTPPDKLEEPPVIMEEMEETVETITPTEPAEASVEEIQQTPLPDGEEQSPAVFDSAENCFAQSDSSVVCICETSKACTELHGSGQCEPGTHWLNSEDSSAVSGGCIKIE